MKKLFAYIFLGVMLGSCIYPYTPELESDPERTLVVDGQILVGGISTFRLNYLTPLTSWYSLLHDSPQDGYNGYTSWIPFGTVWVEDEEGNRYGMQENVPTNYFRIDTGNATLGKRYRAVVEVDGEHYTSSWLDPNPAPVITDITFDADEYNVYVYVDLDSGLEGSGYIGFLYEETWQFHSDFYPEYEVIPGSWTYRNTMESQFEYSYYWCYRTLNSQQIVLLDYSNFEGGQVKKFPIQVFPRTDSRNHKRYSINVKAFALSKEAFQYNKQMQEMSEIGGDLFSPDPGALQGNLTCESNPDKDVLGMVLAGDVTSKRAFLYNTYLIRRPVSFDFVMVTQEEMPLYYYDMNYRPVQETHTEELGTFIGWGPHRCINCVEAGGYQETPDFWID